MEAAASLHAAAGINKKLRLAGVTNPKSKVVKSKTLGVASTRFHVFFDGISFSKEVGKEQGWACLSKPLPFTIQMGTKEYNFTIKNISPAVCVQYGRRKCCWKPFSPETVCGCKQHRPDRKNQPKFGNKNLPIAMQQGMRDAAASHEASVAAHDEELASAPASAEVKEGGAVEGAVEDKAKGPDPTPNEAAPTGPPSKRSASPLGPALKKVLGRRAERATVLKDSTVTIKCAKVSPHKSAIWDSTLGYPVEGPGSGHP